MSSPKTPSTETSKTEGLGDRGPSLLGERVLVLAPVGRDAALACELLTAAGFVCSVAADAKELRKRLRKGAGAVLLTEEALVPETRKVLGKVLETQPSWSELPLILLTKGVGKSRAERLKENDTENYTDAPLGSYNVTVLERPVRLPTLVSVVQASLRARRRQYELRDLVEQLENLNASLERQVDERTRALEKSEEQFTLALHLSSSPMIIVDALNLCLVDVNEAFLQLTGYERTEAVARTTLELDLFVKSKALEAALRGRQPQPPQELLIRTKSGAQRSVLASSRLIQWNKKPMLLATLFDITERKETEEQLMRAIQEVMNDTSWFSQQVMERLAHARSGDRGPLPEVDLSRRERQVLERLAQGTDNERIAEDLGVAAQTLRNYISTIYSKLGVHSRAEAIVWARERGIVGL